MTYKGIRSTVRLAIVAGLVVMAAMYSVAAGAQTVKERKPYTREDIDSFITFYGRDLDQLNAIETDVAFIDIRHIPGDTAAKKKVVQDMKNRGVWVFHYIAAGLDTTYYNPTKEMKPYYYDFDGNGIPEPETATHVIWVNANHPEWIEEVLRRIKDEAVDMGADGIFMDVLNSELVKNAPWEYKEGLELIKAIRSTFPDLKMVVNRTINILEDMAPYIDGLMLEFFTSRWVTNTSFTEMSASEQEAHDRLAQRINSVRRNNPWPVYILDYAAMTNTEVIQKALDRAWAFDFVPYVSGVRLLNQLATYDVQPTVERGSRVPSPSEAALRQCPPPRNDPHNIALAANGGVVRVDSYFLSYDHLPLNDGYRNESCLNWREVAWASSLQGDNHWVEVWFPEPKKPKVVDIHWRAGYSSQEVHVQTLKDEEWVTVTTLREPEGGKDLSSVLLPEIEPTRAIRLLQERDKGPLNYSNPNIMWIAEIEIYESEFRCKEGRECQ